MGQHHYHCLRVAAAQECTQLGGQIHLLGVLRQGFECMPCRVDTLKVLITMSSYSRYCPDLRVQRYFCRLI